MQVNAIGVLAVSGNPSTLTVSAPAAGGDTPANASNNATYVQYTSTVGASNARKLARGVGRVGCGPGRLFAQADGDAVPARRDERRLDGGSDHPVFDGAGHRHDDQELRHRDGRDENGTKLTYLLDVTSMTDLVAGESKSATVTLTLTDAA